MFETRIKETPYELAVTLIDIQHTEDMFVNEGMIYTLLDQNQVDLEKSIEHFSLIRSNIKPDLTEEELVLFDNDILIAKKFIRNFMVINHLSFNETLDTEPTQEEIEIAKSIVWDMANVMIKHSHFYNPNDVETISGMEDTLRKVKSIA